MGKRITLEEQLVRAWDVSTPLVLINTPDPFAAIFKVSQLEASGAPEAVAIKDAALLRWDIVSGIMMLHDNEASTAAYKALVKDQSPSNFQNPADMLREAKDLPPTTVLFAMNMHRWMDPKLEGAGMVVQAVLNLRDEFKMDRRMLIMLAPAMVLPPELAQDVMVLDEPLPDEKQLESIVKDLYTASTMKLPAPKIMTKVVDAVRGLAAFPAEQALAMSMAKDGPDLDVLRERKLRTVEETAGLKAYRGTETFEDVRGLSQLKKLFTGIFKGPKAPRDVYYIDEIEKLFGGLGTSGGPGDNTGVTQDILGVWLRAMEDNGWNGALLVGVPGAGKSLIAKAAANTFGAQTYSLDTGALKTSLLGETEQKVRVLVKTMYGISGERAFLVATCNDLDVLPTALRRRFKAGIWFFDFPTKEERDQMWKQYIALFGLTKQLERPDDENWTGAEIRNVCDMAWQLNCSLKEAAQFTVPVSKADPRGVEALRMKADNNFLATGYPGPYKMPKTGLGVVAQDSKGRRALLTGNN